MSETAEAPKKKGGGAKMLLVGLALALGMGGGAFYVVYSGLVGLPLPPANAPEQGAEAHAAAAAEGHGEAAAPEAHGEAAPKLADGVTTVDPAAVSFAALEPILVSLGGSVKQLQLVAQLEVEPGAADAVAALQPRVRDVLTTYLRAVDPDDVENPASLLRMRAQMLRRVQVVTGEGKVRDLLVSEFVVR